MSGWFSQAELGSIRKLAQLGMQTDVLIKRYYNAVHDEHNIYGDDDLDFIPSSIPTEANVKGWLYSSPSPVISVIGGRIGLVNTYRLYLPVGTQIESGDRVVIGINEFIVSDTTDESTWLPLLAVSLRRVE